MVINTKRGQIRQSNFQRVLLSPYVYTILSLTACFLLFLLYKLVDLYKQRTRTTVIVNSKKK